MTMTAPAAPSILLVGDDAAFIDGARAALRGAAYSVLNAASASQAAAFLGRGRIALILTDLPYLSSLELIEKARKLEPLAVGIVVSRSPSSAMEALRQGAYDWLPKPCPSESLVAAARRAVEHYHLKLALFHSSAQLEKAREQIAEKSRMIQNVSHELKNPLSVVYGYAAFLLRQGADLEPAELKSSVTSIFKNAERLGHLLDELQESTRLSNNKVELNREAMRACHVCRETIENFRPEAAKRGITLALKCHCPEAVIHADPQRLHQILSNLMTNAVKFTPEGGAIMVTASKDEGFVSFCVSDTGCGISADDIPHLFERFYQSEHSGRKHQGLGLGLEITKGLVELHGGRIWVESRPGRGSAFYFTLPLEIAHASPAVVKDPEPELEA
jgi:signal transduction histidine kinase